MNYGDDINVYFLGAITGKKIIPAEALIFPHTNICAIGSLIPAFLDNKTIIWGSGVSNDEMLLKYKPKRVEAVRGPLSREYLMRNGVFCPEVYGDPALLLPVFYKPQYNVCKYKLTLIPHHRDWDTKDKLLNICKKCFPDANILNLADYGHWLDVIDVIFNSEFVISSSLHGIIVSDSYGIPNLFSEFIHSHKIYTKYEDYKLSVGLDFHMPIKIENVRNEHIESVKAYYKSPNIDVDGLLKSCPFEIKNKNICR